MNAWRTIARTTTPLIFGARSLDTKDVPLPLRFLSGDGLCALDVKLKKNALGDVANGLAVSNAAKSLLDECGFHHVERSGSGSGGSITDFSEFNMSTSRRRQLKCVWVGVCKLILQNSAWWRSSTYTSQV